jgi:hypothetical protein
MPRRSQHYQGTERRRHKMYVTRNTEYHVRDGVCVAVRSRVTGDWLPVHDALSQPVLGSVSVRQNGEVLPSRGAPKVGDALFFERPGRELLTSALCSIERPARDVVDSYPNG